MHVSYHSDGNNGHIDTLEIAGNGGETSTGGNFLRSRRSIQKLSNLFGSVFRADGDDSVRNITKAYLLWVRLWW